MDPHGNIYEADPSLIPPEDKARLEGFLKGRAEASEKAKREELESDLADLKRKLEEVEARHVEGESR